MAITTEVHVKTRTEVLPEKNTFSIHCFSDMDQDGSTAPSIFKADLLQEPKIVDNVEGKEGELLLSHDDYNSGEIDSEGNLIIDTKKDDLESYYYHLGGTDNSDLLYTK